MAYAPHDGGLFSDLGALKRWFWLPVLTVTIAILAALAIGALSSSSTEARFRSTVLVDALPPLFGPPLLPGPVEYAALATDDTVVAEVSRDTGVAPDALRARMTAAPRFNQPQIDFSVTGPNALAIARAWRDAVNDAVIRETPAIELRLAQPYRQQLDEARATLTSASEAVAAAPGDPVAQQEVKAAQENYETASRLWQSYNVVSATMTAQLLSSTGPHLASEGIGSTAGRIGAALAFGLLAGVLGALALEALSRRARGAEPAFDDAPADLPRVGTASRSR
jgi:hypothetical protein